MASSSQDSADARSELLEVLASPCLPMLGDAAPDLVPSPSPEEATSSQPAAEPVSAPAEPSRGDPRLLLGLPAELHSKIAKALLQQQNWACTSSDPEKDLLVLRSMLSLSLASKELRNYGAPKLQAWQLQVLILHLKFRRILDRTVKLFKMARLEVEELARQGGTRSRRDTLHLRRSAGAQQNDLRAWVKRAKWLTGRQAEAEEFLRLIVSSCSQLDGFLKELSTSLRNAGSGATAAALASVN